MQNVQSSNINNQFNKELLELLCNDDEDDENVCLISNLPLENNHIKLVCGHKFNYKSIFNEIRNQKRFSHYETQKLKMNEIKCPYCRNVQTGLLPHYGNFRKIKGVNWPEKSQFKPSKCSYIYVSGNKKGLICDKPCFNNHCSKHAKIIEKRKEKQKEKQKEKSSKEKKDEVMKDFHNNFPLQNFIIDNITQEFYTTCAYVFRRGKNKGKRCQCKKKFNHSTHCKSHYKYLE